MGRTHGSAVARGGDQATRRLARRTRTSRPRDAVLMLTEMSAVIELFLLCGAIWREPEDGDTVADPMVDTTTFPDLLHATPSCRIDVEQTKLAIALAFASGVSGGLFADALDRATMAPSTFHPPAFENDLFVSTFVASCLKVHVSGIDATISTKYLTRLVTRPPSDPATVAHRRLVLHELTTSPELRKKLEALYVTLCRFRGLLEGATNQGKWDQNRRQLDLLVLVKDLVDQMATGFRDTQSGLSRLCAFGERIRAGEAYRSLVDLLSYDENMATLSLNVGIGADGRIRGFRILEVKKDPNNPFVGSTFQRWMAKLELFLRGYSFGDGIEAVEKANGGPFAVSGFEWDYGGFVTDWKGGKLKEAGGCATTVRFALTQVAGQGCRNLRAKLRVITCSIPRCPPCRAIPCSWRWSPLSPSRPWPKTSRSPSTM